MDLDTKGLLSLLIEPKTLQSLLKSTTKNANDEDTPHVFIFDCSWLGLPIFRGRNPISEFTKMRIPGSYFFAIDDCCDLSAAFPHMIPSLEDFEKYLIKCCRKSCTDKGATRFPQKVDSKRDVFVVYDSLGIWSAPRVWWMLKIFGIKHAFILNGGLCQWIKEGYQVEESASVLLSSEIMEDAAENNNRVMKVEGLQFNKSTILSYENIRNFIEDPALQKKYALFDARPNGRFEGIDPEPRPDISSGHLPGSINIPWNSILSVQTLGRKRSALSGQILAEGDENDIIMYTYYIYKDQVQIRNLFDNSSERKYESYWFTCGSGVSACVLLVGATFAKLFDWKQMKVYDESWTGYQLRQQSGLICKQK